MGTKEKPGEFDCYATLKPNEPYFLLKGSDILAAPLVYLWAAAREGKIGGKDWDDALGILTQAAIDKGPHNPDKTLEAKVTGLRMLHYACEANGGHDRLDTSTPMGRARGYRPGYCRKCRMDMTEDSSD